MKNRTHYAQMTTEALERMLRSVNDRIERADTAEAWMADAFQQQEIEAVLQARKPKKMTKLQKVYREVRKYMNREDARYAAFRIIKLGV